MAAHTFRLVQNATVVWDFHNASNNIATQWQPAPYSERLKKVEDTLIITPKGSSVTAFFNNLVTLGQVITDGLYNFSQWQNGMPYTPIWLQFKKDNSPTMMQSEFFGGDRDAIDNFLSAALRSNILPNLSLKISRRPYWEETATQNVSNGTSVSNNGAAATITSIRGDVPTPLQIQVTTATTNQDRVIVGIKHNGTPANFVCQYEGESATTLGSGVASVADANCSGGNLARWTPASTTEQSLLIQNITSNVADNMGRFRLLVRCFDYAAQANTKIRARGGIYSTLLGTYKWGDFADFAKYTDGTGDGSGSVGYPGVTGAAIALIDCGILTLPPVDTQGVAPTGLAIDIWGAALLTGASNRFGIDCFYLIPCYEQPYGSGYVASTFPSDLGNSNYPVAQIDSNDRVPSAYLQGSGSSFIFSATDIRGKPLCAWNSDTQAVYILTQNSGNLRHTYNLTNTVTILATPRYRFPGRGT